MNTSSRFYLIGTKYGRSEDVLPEMVSDGVISTGFVDTLDLSPIIGKDHALACSWIDKQIPNESSTARKTLALFAGIRPGDVVALKAHSAPRGSQARLVIARYAIVTGSTQSIYARSSLGHTLKVDFLDEQEPIELPLGYGGTLHMINDPQRIKIIFGCYADSAHFIAPAKDKAIHTSEVSARGAYLMQRVHNGIQNELRNLLTQQYGESAVTQEEQFVDLIVRLPEKTLLIEIKSSPSPITCIREAIGQLLQYGWKLGLSAGRVAYFIVGPSVISNQDLAFINHVVAETRMPLTYCTSQTFPRSIVY